jgi:TIR domain
MDIDTLYPLVTDAIRRAEVLDELSAPGARNAYLDVSLLEESIASLLPASDGEGQIARRGAVSAAISAREHRRAEELAIRYSSEESVNDALRRDLDELRRRAFELSEEDSNASVNSTADQAVLARHKHVVFLSYAAEDMLSADLIRASLEYHRIRCWIGPRDVPPGDDWSVNVSHAVEAARCVVLLLSHNANKSQHVLHEVEWARRLGLPLLTLKIEDVHPDEWAPLYSISTKRLELFRGSLEIHLPTVVEEVHRVVYRPVGTKCIKTTPITYGWRALQRAMSHLWHG